MSDVQLRDDVAEMIADWWGRSVIEPDRELAQQIIDRVLGAAADKPTREPTYGWRPDERA